MPEQNDVKKLHKSNRILFILELTLAVLIIFACVMAGMSNLFWLSNDLYPDTAEAMGHLKKVVYIAEQLAQGHLPSWFPFWYNGSTVTQYDVPLSYYLMVPIYWLTNNVMLTYKIFCGIVLSVGSFGVWSFCYRKIGRFCGLAGIIAFCLQPILMETLYREGAIAEGLVIAIMPWFLLVILSFAENPKRLSFIGVCILTTLLILSHAMNALMVCITTLIVLLIFVILKKINILNFILTGACITIAVLLTAFWSVVGAIQLENPGIPYQLPESTYRYTATYHWFLPDDENGVMHFSIAILGVILVSILIYLIAMLLKNNNEKQRFYGLGCILMTIVTIIFSFGTNLPGFQSIPMTLGFAPGRILTYTAVAGAVVCAYGIAKLWNASKVRVITVMLSFVIIAGIIYVDNPFINTYQGVPKDKHDSMGNTLDSSSSPFEQGRYQWYGPLDSQEMYYLYDKNINISNGWNIEGTLHNHVLHNNQIALPLKYYGYVEKQVAYWNIRNVMLSDDYSDFGTQLEKNLGFEKTNETRGSATLYTSKEQSSYYLVDQRNSLIISNQEQGFSVHYPNMVQGKSENLWDYSQKELLKYKVIYIIEPSITTRRQKTKFENMITELINAGVIVMIEPKTSNTFDLFDVHAANEFVKNSPLFKITTDCPYPLENKVITNNSNYRTIRSLYGLDQVYANLEFNGGNITNAVLGTKKVGKGEVLFIGTHLSQYLEAVYSRNMGVHSLSIIIKNNSKYIESIYSSIFSYYGVEEEYLPQKFESVEKQSWDYQGGSFTYKSNQASEITISLTYTPRWTATVDGKNIEVGQRENLITLNLPAGEHTVKLYYGITLYGKIGYMISAACFILFLITIILWNWIMKHLENCAIALRRYLQFSEVYPVVEQGQQYSDEEEKEIAAATMEAAAAMETAYASGIAEGMEVGTMSLEETEGMEAGTISSEETEATETNIETTKAADNYSEESEFVADGTDEEYPRYAQKTVDENGVKIVLIETGTDDKLSQEVDEAKAAASDKRRLSKAAPRNHITVKKKSVRSNKGLNQAAKLHQSDKSFDTIRNSSRIKNHNSNNSSRINKITLKTIKSSGMGRTDSRVRASRKMQAITWLQGKQIKIKKRPSAINSQRKRDKKYIKIKSRKGSN